MFLRHRELINTISEMMVIQLSTVWYSQGDELGPVIGCMIYSTLYIVFCHSI